MKHRAWAIVWLFVPGAILGTGLDAFHAYNGVEHYPEPVLLGVAWWVPLLFGAAAVAIGYSHPLLDPVLHSRRRPQHLFASITELTWLLLAYLVAASNMLDSISKAGLLLMIYCSFWLLAGKIWQNLLLSLVTAFIGTLIEMTLVASGAFSYLHPDMLGVPYWLPCLYASASLAIGDLGRSLITLTSMREERP